MGKWGREHTYETMMLHREAHLYIHTHINLTHRTNTHTHTPTYTYTEHKLYLVFNDWAVILSCRVMSQWKQQTFQEPRSKGGDGGEQEEGEEKKKTRGRGERAEEPPWAEARLLPEGQCQWAGRGKRLSGKPCFLSRRIFELGMKTFCASWRILQLQRRLLEVCQQSSWRKSKASRFCLAFFLNYCVHIMLF